ncbi:hypothetical protein GCM10027275_34350 [Rhabdobacter roseus]
MLFVFLFGHRIQAQSTLRSVEEALTLAEQHNPDLRAARQTAQWQAGAVEVARAGRLPTLRAYSSLDFNYALPVQLVPAEFLGGPPGEYQKLRFGLPYILSAAVEANYALWNPVLGHEVRLADLNRQTADLQAQAQQEQLSTQVIRAYYLTALSREAVRISEENLQSTDTLLTLANERYRAGVIEQLDLNRIRSTRLSLADQLEQNQLAYLNNRRQLSLLVGQEVEVPAEAAQRWTELGPPQERLGTLDSYPQVRLRTSQLSYYEAMTRREQATRLPQLSLYGRHTVQAQRDAFNFLNVGEPWFTIGLVGVRLDVPIFNGGQRLRSVERARVRTLVARTELEAEQKRQQAQDDEWLASFTQASRSLTLNRENMELATQNVDLALIKYQAGVYTYDQYLNIFNENLQAQNRYLRTLADGMIYGALLRTRQ